MRGKIRVIMHGLGVHGRSMASLILQKQGIEIVGAIDIAEEIVGKDLGEVIGIDKEVGITVSAESGTIFSKVKADIVLDATVSFASQVWPGISNAVEAGMNVITIAEEMCYPQFKYPELAKEIDEKAKKYGVTVLGSGVNPGFGMDFLVLALSGLCHDIKKIEETRWTDWSPLDLRDKQGWGLTVDEFDKRRNDGALVFHVGLRPMMNMVADTLGWKLDEVKETVEAVVATKYIKTHPETPKASQIEIPPGKVYGFDQTCSGIKNGREVIIFKTLGRVDPELESKAIISFEATPNIAVTMQLPPFVGLVQACSAHVVNHIPHVINAKPGLVTVKDLPIATCLLVDVRNLLLSTV